MTGLLSLQTMTGNMKFRCSVHERHWIENFSPKPSHFSTTQCVVHCPLLDSILFVNSQTLFVAMFMLLPAYTATTRRMPPKFGTHILQNEFIELDVQYNWFD